MLSFGVDLVVEPVGIATGIEGVCPTGPGLLPAAEGVEDVAGVLEDRGTRRAALVGDGEVDPRQGLGVVSRLVECPRVGVFEVSVARRQGHHLGREFHGAFGFAPRRAR